MFVYSHRTYISHFLAHYFPSINSKVVCLYYIWWTIIVKHFKICFRSVVVLYTMSVIRLDLVSLRFPPHFLLSPLVHPTHSWSIRTNLSLLCILSPHNRNINYFVTVHFKQINKQTNKPKLYTSHSIISYLYSSVSH